MPLPIAGQRTFQHHLVGAAVHEKLSLPQRAALAREFTHQLVNVQTLLSCEREAPLLAVSVRGFGGPGLRRQVRWFLTLPDILRQLSCRKGRREQVGLGHVLHADVVCHGCTVNLLINVVNLD